MGKVSTLEEPVAEQERERRTLAVNAVTQMRTGRRREVTPVYRGGNRSSVW